MKLILKISPEIYERIGEHIQKGGFRDINEFVDIACRNQLTAEGDDIGWPSSASKRRQETPRDGAEPSEVSDMAAALLAPPGGKVVTVDPLPSSAVVNSDTPLWGQYYRFLPMKVGARVLANLGKEGPVPLLDFQTAASETAARFRLHLLVLDRRSQRKVGEKLATSFPSEDEKSLKRYVAQFLVDSRPTDGRHTGFMARVFFASTLSKDGKQLAAVTPSGRAFAGLKNPVIDGDDSPSEMLSAEERDFLLSHLKKFVRPECDHMAAILGILRDAPKTGEDITDELRGFYKTYQKDDEGWSLAMMSTMRAGATSRMSELGLIQREIARRGAPFVIAERGKEWLAEFTSK